MRTQEDNERRQGKSTRQQEASEILAAVGIIGILVALLILQVIDAFN
jgi:hypothetical protein